MSGEISELPQVMELIAERQRPLTLYDIQQKARDIDASIAQACWPVANDVKLADAHPLMHVAAAELHTQIRLNYPNEWVNWQGSVYQMSDNPEHRGLQFGYGSARLMGVTIVPLPDDYGMPRPTVTFALGGVGFLDTGNGAYLHSAYFCPAQSSELDLKQSSVSFELLTAEQKLQAAPQILLALNHGLQANFGTPDLSMLGTIYDHLPNGEIKQASLDYLSAALYQPEHQAHLSASHFLIANLSTGLLDSRPLGAEPFIGIGSNVVSIPASRIAGNSEENEMLCLALESCVDGAPGVFMVAARDIDHYQVIPS